MNKKIKTLLCGVLTLGAISGCFLSNVPLNIESNASTVATTKKVTKTKTQITKEVVALAKTKVGCKYSQEPSKRNGPKTFDTSGLVRYLYKQVTGVDIGLWTGEQEQVLKKYKVSMNNIQAGDLLYSNGHVAIYIGNGEIIHATNPKMGVVKAKLSKSMKFDRAYRPVNFVKK